MKSARDTRTFRSGVPQYITEKKYKLLHSSPVISGTIAVYMLESPMTIDLSTWTTVVLTNLLMKFDDHRKDNFIIIGQAPIARKNLTSDLKLIMSSTSHDQPYEVLWLSALKEVFSYWRDSNCCQHACKPDELWHENQ